MTPSSQTRWFMRYSVQLTLILLFPYFQHFHLPERRSLCLEDLLPSKEITVETSKSTFFKSLFPLLIFHSREPCCQDWRSPFPSSKGSQISNSASYWRPQSLLETFLTLKEKFWMLQIWKEACYDSKYCHLQSSNAFQKYFLHDVRKFWLSKISKIKSLFLIAFNSSYTLN